MPKSFVPTEQPPVPIMATETEVQTQSASRALEFLSTPNGTVNDVAAAASAAAADIAAETVDSDEDDDEEVPDLLQRTQDDSSDVEDETLSGIRYSSPTRSAFRNSRSGRQSASRRLSIENLQDAASAQVSSLTERIAFSGLSMSKPRSTRNPNRDQPTRNPSGLLASVIPTKKKQRKKKTQPAQN